MTTAISKKAVATDDVDPIRSYGRAAGLLFVVLLVLGPISILYIPSQLIVADDPAATADKLRESEGLFRTAIVIDVVILLVEVAMAAVLYALFRTVSRTLAAATSLARLAQAAVMGANLFLYFLALLTITGAAGYMTALDLDDREALTLLFLETHGYGVYVGQAFFGVSLLALALLARRAAFVPPVFGPLLLVAALGYLVDSFVSFVTDDLDEVLSTLVGITSLIGELPFFLWLLVASFRRRPMSPFAGDPSRGPSLASGQTEPKQPEGRLRPG